MIGYTQSDEMTFIIRSDQSEDASAWFDNRIQKIVSVSSGIVSSVFNRLLFADQVALGREIDEISIATFDGRLHPVPSLTEAVNNLVWRQRDCTKNSISGAAYYELGKKCGKKTARRMLEGLKQDQRQELLFKETGINWNDYAPEFKRGVVIFKREEEVSTEHGNVIRRKWTTEAAPIFTSEDGRAWLNEILGHSRSAKENVQEKEGIRQDQDAQENQQG
jgi:tRNA(His) 5'-end guanylyltransferase